MTKITVHKQLAVELPNRCQKSDHPHAREMNYADGEPPPTATFFYGDSGVLILTLPDSFANKHAMTHTQAVWTCREDKRLNPAAGDGVRESLFSSSSALECRVQPCCIPGVGRFLVLHGSGFGSWCQT